MLFSSISKPVIIQEKMLLLAFTAYIYCSALNQPLPFIPSFILLMGWQTTYHISYVTAPKKLRQGHIWQF